MKVERGKAERERGKAEREREKAETGREEEVQADPAMAMG